MSWREQVDDEVHFVLDQYAMLNFYSVSSLKQQSADRYIAQLGLIILILSQPDFVLSPLCCVLSRDATNNNFLSFWHDPIWARTCVAIVVVIAWYICNHCLSPLKVCIRTLFMARCFLYNIMWYSLSVTYDMSEVFSGYYGFLHQQNWSPRYYRVIE